MDYLETARRFLAAEQARREGLTPEAAEVAAMPLSQFATAGLIVEVHSTLLGGSVLLVSDDVPDVSLASASLPIYRAAELSKLAVLRPEPRSLRTLHEIKTLFQGTITDVQPSEESDDPT